MTEFIDSFYHCVGKTIVADILSKDGEYLVRESRQREEVGRLVRILDGDLAPRVDALLAEQLAIGELRESAYFRAGFRMALELTR